MGYNRAGKRRSARLRRSRKEQERLALKAKTTVTPPAQTGQSKTR